MTNEEAIEILRKIPVDILNLNNEDKWDLTEAIEIAINALSLYKKEPLTLEQLREMDGRPVWIVGITQKWLSPRWAIVDRDNCLVRTAINWSPVFFENYGRTWLAYAYPPIDRDKWEPCVMCESCVNCWFCMNSKTGRPCIDCDKYSKFNPVSYCRYCGRPLTQEAWAELEKRIRGEGMKFKVGAKIVVKDVHCGGNFENGDIVTVVEIGSEDDPNCYGAISPHDGLVWYLYDDEVSSATNADHIRSMTDEELAKEFVVAGEFENRVCFCCEYFKCLQNKDGYCIYKHGRCNMDARLEAYKKWLQQPAEE